MMIYVNDGPMGVSIISKELWRYVTSNHGDCYLYRNNTLKLDVKGGQVQYCCILSVLPYLAADKI